MRNKVNLEKDIKVNNKDVKSNKSKFTTTANGDARNNTVYHRHQTTYESSNSTDKIAQLDTLIQSWVVGYDDLVVVYSTVKQDPVIQLQLVNPRFRPIHSNMYKQLRLDPLADMGVTVVRDIVTNTYYYTIPL
jgi:hypothetical protein